MARLPHVVLMIETSSNYARRILSGVARYLDSHRPWSIFLEERSWDEALPHWLTNWRGDGLISRSLTRQASLHLRKLKVPMVNLNDFRSAGFWLPLIRSDNRAIGRLAAEHLKQRCFRHFAFCGFADLQWSLERRDSFRAALDGRQLFWGEYESSWDGKWSHSWERRQGEMSRWLLSLPKPVGVLACNDTCGRHIVDTCLETNLAVPDEVAVIGVDDDALLCQLCHPPLSSVVLNPERIGYEAAVLLDRLMAGGRSPRREWLIPPLGVTTRQSTDVLAIDDPDFAAAISYIRQHACQGTSVRQVLQRVPISRTILERKCRKYLGHSPHAEIRAVQLRRIQQLLTETALPLQRIAVLAGYKHPEYLSTAFKHATGQTPGEYRRQVQSSSHERKSC